MQLEPHTRTLKIGPEINAERREDESANNAVDAHKHAAEKIDRARGLVGQALGEIDDISREMKESMRDGKKLPSDSEMQQAVERAREVNGTKTSGRRAEQQS